jgi:hypothetical protein
MLNTEQLRTALKAYLAAIHQHGGVPTDGSAPPMYARIAGIRAAVSALKMQEVQSCY